LHAKGVAIWRKEPDGSWRCIIDIWNEAPPPADAPGP
jgi:ketosteroid isomerase-like protein